MEDFSKGLFLKYLRFEKRYSEHTICAYINDLYQFYTFHLKQDPNFDFLINPNYKFVKSWIIELTRSGLSTRSINRKLSSLKKFCKYHTASGKLTSNPFDKIISPKTHKKLPSFLNYDEINNLATGSIFQDDSAGKRDRAIIELLYCTGIRLSELINLKTSDISFSSSIIKVLGKRNKERLIPVPESLIPILKDYIEEKGKMGYLGTDLFVTNKGDKIYPRLVQRIVYKHLSVITTNEKKNPHILRHTYATHLLNNGAEINAIKELLGHANLSATQIYTHNTFQKLNKIYKLAHPRA